MLLSRIAPADWFSLLPPGHTSQGSSLPLVWRGCCFLSLDSWIHLLLVFSVSLAGKASSTPLPRRSSSTVAHHTWARCDCGRLGFRSCWQVVCITCLCRSRITGIDMSSSCSSVCDSGLISSMDLRVWLREAYDKFFPVQKVDFSPDVRFKKKNVPGECAVWTWRCVVKWTNALRVC